MVHKKLFSQLVVKRFTRNSFGKLIKLKQTATAISDTFNKSIKPVRLTKDQRLILPNKKELKLLGNSDMLPNRPIDVENSVIVRLVKISDPVTSPVGSALLCSQYGLKGNESFTFILISLTAISILIALGFWQLNRSKWKAQVITARQLNLSLPIIHINGLYNLTDCLYRVVEASGVLDVTNEFYVGPRSSMKGDGKTGFLVICPLRFNDGSCILINRGWLEMDLIEGKRRNDEIPEWVTVRGVVTGGELVDDPVGIAKNSIFKLKNSPFRRNTKVYLYLDPKDIGDHVVSKNPDIAKHVVLNAYDIIYHDDQQIYPIEARSKLFGLKNRIIMDKILNNDVEVPEFYKPILNLSSQDYMLSNDDTITDVNKNLSKTSKRHRYTRNFQTKSKTDYLTFYADEYTHLNYAVQWFLMAASLFAMTVYKLVHIRKLKRFIKMKLDKQHTVFGNVKVD